MSGKNSSYYNEVTIPCDVCGRSVQNLAPPGDQLVHVPVDGAHRRTLSYTLSARGPDASPEATNTEAPIQMADRKILDLKFKSAFLCSHNLKLDGHILETRATYGRARRRSGERFARYMRDTDGQKIIQADSQTEVCGIYR